MWVVEQWKRTREKGRGKGNKILRNIMGNATMLELRRPVSNDWNLRWHSNRRDWESQLALRDGLDSRDERGTAGWSLPTLNLFSALHRSRQYVFINPDLFWQRSKHGTFQCLHCFIKLFQFLSACKNNPSAESCSKHISKCSCSTNAVTSQTMACTWSLQMSTTSTSTFSVLRALFHHIQPIFFNPKTCIPFDSSFHIRSPQCATENTKTGANY